jgi:tetratricopeptide (TPR) repeat protein
VRSLVRTLAHDSETLPLGVSACQGVLSLGWRLGTPTDEAARAFEEGRQLAEQSGDVQALAALNGIYGCVLGLVDGRSDEYVHYSRVSTRLADQTENVGLQIAQRAFLGFGCAFAGRLAEGLESSVATCLRMPADPALGAEFTGYSPYLGIQVSMAYTLGRLGRFDEALEVCKRAEQLARAHGDFEILTWLEVARMEVVVWRSDAAALNDCARRARESSEKSATPQAHFVGILTLGVAHRLNGAWDESVRLLREALGAAVGGANRMFEGKVRAELSSALQGSGELDRAEEEGQAAVSVSRAQHSRCEEVRGCLALARVLLRRAETSALARAQEALSRAQELLDESGALAFQPDVYECLGRLALLSGDAQAAARAFDDALRLYTERGAPLQVARLAKQLASVN